MRARLLWKRVPHSAELATPCSVAARRRGGLGLRLAAAMAALMTFACGEDSATSEVGADRGTDTAPPVSGDATLGDTGQGDAGADAGAGGGPAPDASAGGADGADIADAAAPDAALGPAFCTGAVAHRWTPLAPDDPDLFPDGLLVRTDASSPTGWRLELTETSAPWAARLPSILKDTILAMNTLTGFGAMGGAVLRFTGPVSGVPQTADESVTSAAWQWWDLGDETPVRVPFEARVQEGGLTVVLWPLRPLRLATRHALVLTRAARADDGDCIAPAPTTQVLLGGRKPEPADSGLPPSADPARVAVFAPIYREALDRLGLDPADVSALTVYPTHDDLAPVRAAAADLLARPVAWGPAGGCVESEGLVECEATTTVLDYRNAAGAVEGAAVPREGTIPVTWWRPAGAVGPLPVVVYGHGLNSLRDEGRFIAERVVELGIAVVAMEAVEHGEHPFKDPEATGEDALRFLGIDLTRLKIDGTRLAGNFNQTALDRLGLVGLLHQNGDPDGDGTPDLDPGRVAYLGASLGAMTGAGVLALSPDLDAAVLTIGGARLMSVVTDTEAVAEYQPIIGNLMGSVERFERLVPIMQHAIDAADPGTWAAHILHDRFDARPPPSVLANFGMSDEVVPPSAGRALARALGAPHLAPVQVPVEFVEVIDAPQVVGNREGGTRTAAFFQLATVTRHGETMPATHVDTAKSEEAAAQIRAFFGPWAVGEVPVIVRP